MDFSRGWKEEERAWQLPEPPRDVLPVLTEGTWGTSPYELRFIALKWQY